LCQDTDDWGEILRDFKHEFAQWEREFHPATKTWSVPLYCRARVRRWAERWFDPDRREYVEGEPAGGSYGSRSYSNSRSGYGRCGEPQSATTAVDRAYAELHLLPTAPPELVRAAHRILIKQVHPDAGGSHEATVKINLAWELVREDQERRSA
jgi:hypothetical protein